MATTTTPNSRLSPLPQAAGRAGLRGAIASEFTKIRSVRSTYWTLAALLVVSIGIGAAITGGSAANFGHNPGNKAGFDATQASLIAFFEIGQLIIGVIAAMTITAEYSTGMIRTSLNAQPRRGLRREGHRAHVADARRLARHLVRRVLPGPGAAVGYRRERLAVPLRHD